MQRREKGYNAEEPLMSNGHVPKRNGYCMSLVDDDDLVTEKPVANGHAHQNGHSSHENGSLKNGIKANGVLANGGSAHKNGTVLGNGSSSSSTGLTQRKTQK